MVYVSEVYNKRIQKFTSDGDAMAVIEMRVSVIPDGLCIDSNNIFMLLT